MTSVEPVHALNLDSSQQQAFIRYYRSLPEKPSTTIRIFNRTEYYSVHGEDASFASREVFKTTAMVKVMGSGPKLDYLVLSKSNFERFVRTLLLVKHYHVEVYSKLGASKNMDWQLEFKGSPGNLSQFEDILFDNSNIVVNSIVMAVKIEKDQFLGVSCINTDERKFLLCEFSDNEFFSQLESIIIQMSPRECLVHTNDPQNLSRVKMILQRSNIMCTVQKKMDFCRESIEPDLDRLINFNDGQQKSCNSLPEMKLTAAVSSLHSAIIYLELTADCSYHGKFKVQVLDTKRFVHLDHAAVKALNILPKSNVSPHERRNTSIIGLLDACRTAHGRRTLAQWIKQPLRDINALNDRLDVVEVFVENPALRLNLYNDYLRRIPDLLMIAKKMIRKKPKLQDIYRVYQTIDRLPNMVAALASLNQKTIQSQFIEPLNGFIEDMEKFQRMIETTVDMDLVDKGEFLVKPTYDDELEELYNKKNRLEEKIQNQLSLAAKDLNLEKGKGIKLDYTEQLGYFLRVTLKEEPVLRKKKQYKVVNAVKGGVRFVTSKLEDLNSEYMDTKKMYEDQQSNVVNEIISIAAGYSDTLTSINYVIAQLDVLVAFANVSCSAPKQYMRPNLLPEGSGYLKLTQVRHPCLEVQDGVSFNPNDIEFKQDECTFHIITGPNMGGKSTYIRSVGVAVLMAHIGCFVPCDEAEISLVDSILARVGSEDCQSKGLSTFMLEMVETAGILRTATQNSLIIIDELGRGTSTYEGCGIAWSIAEYLVKEVKAFSMFATHFHEITQLAEEIPSVVNKYVTAVIVDDVLTLLYQVKSGICDQSFGIHVAKMAGFPQDFIKHATEIQHDLEDYRNIKILQQFDVQKRQNILKEGDELIAKVLENCKRLDHKRMSDEELETNIKRIREDVEKSKNPYILALLAE